MKILLCLVLMAIALISISFQAFFIIKKKEYKMLITQLGILSLAIIGGIIIIFKPYAFSIAGMLIKIIPWMSY